MHFGFQARDEDENRNWKAWLGKNKVRITGEREEKGGGMYLKDPDGYAIEIYHEAWRALLIVGCDGLQLELKHE